MNRFLFTMLILSMTIIPKEYAATLVELKDGRIITGILRGETPVALTLVTANETLTLPRQEIDSLKTSKISMMPDDIHSKLKEDEVRALIGYLQSKEQVPLPAVIQGSSASANDPLAEWTAKAEKGDPAAQRVPFRRLAKFADADTLELWRLPHLRR